MGTWMGLEINGPFLILLNSCLQVDTRCIDEQFYKIVVHGPNHEHQNGKGNWNQIVKTIYLSNYCQAHHDWRDIGQALIQRTEIIGSCPLMTSAKSQTLSKTLKLKHHIWVSRDIERCLTVELYFF